MAKKLTKRERIDAKVADGMDHLAAQMAVAEEDHAEKMKKLEAKQKREQARIDEIAVGIVRKNFPEQWAEAQELAREQVEEQRTKRAAAASKQQSPVDQAVADVNDGASVQAALPQDDEGYRTT
ncbi:MAG: hypothetical protein ACI38U_02165 [Corynebacterium sp.]|uniref:hypothetical protein n=1 Tax=Corynebacterium sp. TaxID=1720 RepID=UPI003F0F66AB